MSKSSNLPTYISLDEATEQYGVSKTLLTTAIETGIIRAIQTPEGIMVAEMDVQNLQKEHPTYIPLSEAAQRYQIPTEALLKAVKGGIVKAVKMKEGTTTILAVEVESTQEFAKQLQREPPSPEKKSDLISINEAARRLRLNSGIVYNWYKQGYLPSQGRGKNRVIFVSFRQAQALAKLRQKQGNKRGKRLIPKDADITQILASQELS